MPEVSRSGRLVLYSAAESIQRAEEVPPFLVPGLVSASVTLLTAQPKVGKSRLAACLAVAAATGGQFLGRDFAWPIKRVVILAADPDGANEYSRHLRAAGLGPSDGWVTMDLPVMTQGDWGELAEVVAPLHGDLVVLDPLNGVVGGEMIDGPTTHGAMAGAASLGVPVVVVHHQSTASGYGKRPQGHTNIEAMSRWVLSLSKRGVEWTLSTRGNGAPEGEYHLTSGENLADFVVTDGGPRVAAGSAVRKAAREAASLAAAEWVLANVPPKATNAEVSRALDERYPDAGDLTTTAAGNGRARQFAKCLTGAGSGFGRYLSRDPEGRLVPANRAAWTAAA